MQELLNKLFLATPQLSPKLRKAAKVILDKPSIVAITSMRSLATEAGVTPPTLVRLAEKMGFSSYDRFRAVFQQAIADPNYHRRAGGLRELASKEGEYELIHKMETSAADNIHGFFDQIDPDILSKAADMIRNAPTAYIAAAGAPHWIANYMQYVGRMAIPRLRVPRSSGMTVLESLIPVQKEDVILVFSFHPYAKQTIEAATYAKSQGAKIVYITDSRAAPLASIADLLLLVSTHSPQYFPSMVSVVCALETLIAVIVSRSDKTVVDNIAAFDEIRKQNGVYLESS